MSAHERGEWRTHAFAWWEAIDVHCELCGRPLPGRAWVCVVERAEHRFCEPDCAELYRTRRVSG